MHNTSKEHKKCKTTAPEMKTLNPKIEYYTIFFNPCHSHIVASLACIERSKSAKQVKECRSGTDLDGGEWRWWIPDRYCDRNSDVRDAEANEQESNVKDETHTGKGGQEA
jgi:hypothetical protein